MTVPPPPPAAAPKKRLAKGCGIFAAAIVGLFVLSAVVAGIAGGGKNGTAKPDAKAPASPSPKPSPTASSHPAATPTHSASSAAKPQPSPSRKSCDPTRDVLVWTKVPGLPDSGEVLGNYHLGDCESTFQFLQHSSPTGPGYCTEAAWASDNPGYNADATPAPRLKQVQVVIGPAC